MAAEDVDLRLLVAFEALWLERSVTGAARRLGIGQPGMSGALARLRRLFGDPLFIRAGNAMRPSPRAEALAPELAAGLDRLRRLVAAERHFDPGTLRRGVTLAATDHVAQILVPPLVARLAETAPGVDLRIVAYVKGAVGALLARGEADLALGVFAEPPDSLVPTPLFREGFLGVARLGHPGLEREGTGGWTLPLRAFAAAGHVLVTQNRDARGAVDLALEAAGLVRRVVLTVPWFGALPGVLGGSDLVAVAPARLARRLPGLAVFPPPLALPTWQVSALWHPDRRGDRLLSWLRGELRAVAAGLEGEP